MMSAKTMVTVRRDNDPLKKYWWVLLVGFGLTGLWVLVPLMGQTGSSHVAVPKASSVEEQGLQSLDSAQNPSGAQGSAINLSMDGALGGKKKGDESSGSGLYQAPEGGAPGAPIADPVKVAAAPSLASALKAVSKSDPTGWGGAKPQKGFNAPKGRFGSLSGTGGSSSGGSGASISASPFNSASAKVAVSEAQGTDAGGGAFRPGGQAFMQGVKRVEAASTASSKLASADGARAGTSGSFDGTGASRKTVNSAGGDIVFGKFDYGAAPVNLKDRPTGGEPEAKEPDPMDKIAQAIDGLKGKEVKADYQAQMGQQMGQMVMMMVVGGIMNQVVGGAAGAMLTTYMMQSAQMLNQNNVNK